MLHRRIKEAMPLGRLVQGKIIMDGRIGKAIGNRWKQAYPLFTGALSMMRLVDKVTLRPPRGRRDNGIQSIPPDEPGEH